MSQKLDDIDITQLDSCIKSLETCYDDYIKNQDLKMKEYIEDACVKRFEFSLEISWKTMKRFLKIKYGKNDSELTMNNIFRYMDNYGFITSWKNWRDYYTKRNNPAHEYSQIKARSLILCTDGLIQDMKYLYDKLKSVLVEEK